MTLRDAGGRTTKTIAGRGTGRARTEAGPVVRNKHYGLTPHEYHSCIRAARYLRNRRPDDDDPPRHIEDKVRTLNHLAMMRFVDRSTGRLRDPDVDNT